MSARLAPSRGDPGGWPDTTVSRQSSRTSVGARVTTTPGPIPIITVGGQCLAGTMIETDSHHQPIVVDEQMVILAGHTRLEAARQLGLTEVPVHVARGLTPAQARAYRLMDNRSNENAEWDETLLGLELDDLQLEGFDLSPDIELIEGSKNPP